MPSEQQLRADICEVGRRMWQRGLTAASDGNISVRLSAEEYLATPTGVSKGFMTPEIIVRVDAQGRPLPGEGRPSSEFLLHLAVYRRRPDVCAVVHAHPPLATGFAAAGISLESPILTEVVGGLGPIPLAEYGTPSTEELPRSIEPLLDEHDAFLLANHGALTVGRDVFEAYFRMETVEQCAQVTLVTHQLGGARLIPAEKLTALQAIRRAALNRGPCRPES